MNKKRGLQLNRVVLLGRTLDEYRRIFLIEPEQLVSKCVLDVASGVSSFCAEARELGIEVTSCDPIYEWEPERIRAQSGPDLDSVYKDIQGLPTYRWSFYRNPEHMRELRQRAVTGFLADYERTRGERYVAGKLP